MPNSLEFSFEEDETMMISRDKDIDEKTEELYTNLKAYFEHSNEELTESNLYFSYIFQVPEMLSSCFIMTPCLIKDRNEREMKHRKLKTADICLKILLMYLECPQTVDTTKLIIQTSLSVLHQAYNHCKDSETFYGEFFEEFTNELGSFYKNIQDIQKVSLKRLDILLNNDSYDNETDCDSIILVSRSIGQLCELVTTLDQNISLIFWKVFSRLITKYKDVLLDKIEIDTFLLPLVFHIEDIISQCINSIKSNEKIIESEIKLCIVELSLLKKLIQVFNGHFKPNTITQLRNLSIHLFSLLVLTHSSTVAESKDLSVIRILLKTVKHAIIPFFSDSMFFTSILHCCQKDISPDLQIPLILLKLAALDCLKNYPEHSQLLQKNALLGDIFSTLKENTPDDDLKLVCIKIPTNLVREASNKTTDSITIYQHCYTCLAEYSKLYLNCSDASMIFEKSVLEIFTSCSDVISLLISDVLMHYLRSGSIDNVYKYCNTLARFLKQEQDSRIKQLFIRILKLLPENFKIRLFEENKNLCSILGTCSNVFTLNLAEMKQHTPINDIYLERIISDIPSLNDAVVANDLQKMIQNTCSVLEFGASCIDNLSTAELLKFVEFSSLMFKCDIFEINVAVVSFLKAFNGRTLTKNKEFDSLTSAIAQLLSEVMQSENYIIRHEAFNLYFKLAESTPHPEIVRKTVIKCPGLVPAIKSYSEKVPANGFLKEDTRHAMYQRQLTEYQSNYAFSQHISDKTKQVLADLFT